jgi:hypothetical protein
MELPLEDVIRLVELVGFIVKKQEAKEGIKYTADELGACASFILLTPISDLLFLTLPPFSPLIFPRQACTLMLVLSDSTPSTYSLFPRAASHMIASSGSLANRQVERSSQHR